MREIQLRLPDFSAEVKLEHAYKFNVGITGEVHGAGSTTTAKTLAQILGFSYEYAGLAIREMALGRGYAKSLEDDAGVNTFSAQIAAINPDLEKQEGQYDIRVDTTDFTPQQVVGTILYQLVENRHFFSLLSDATRIKIEAMFPGIQKLYPVE